MGSDPEFGLRHSIPSKSGAVSITQFHTMLEFHDDTPLRGNGSSIAGFNFNRRGVAALFWPDGTFNEDGFRRGLLVLRRLPDPATGC